MGGLFYIHEGDSMKQTKENQIEIVTPAKLKERFQVTENGKQFIAKSVAQVKAILDGEDKRLLIITGPCSIHDHYAAMEYAKNIATLQEQIGDKVLLVMRTYFEKPRSTVGWKGALYDPDMNGDNDMTKGIREARKLLVKINELGVPCATEILDPLTIPYFEDLLSYVAIGARTSESQIHRQAVSGLDVPTGIKNSTDGSIKNAIDAVIAVAGRHTMLAVNDEGILIQKETNGNDYGHVILRGGTSGPNFESNHIEEVGILCEKSVVDSAVIVDCSHQNSRKIHTNQIEVARTLIRDRVNGKSEHLRGIMLESNIHEGAQKMPTHMEDLQYGVSVTDACLGWEQSLSLINELTDML